MAVGTCAWMEARWKEKIDKKERGNVAIARYMDDCLIAENRKTSEEMNKTVRDYVENCYLPPLKLESAGSGIFLETQFTCSPEGELTYRLKNVNAGLKEPQTWRYQRYDSYVPQILKFGVIMGTLHKVERMASNGQQLGISAREKLLEFIQLGYPRKILRGACFRMYGMTNHLVWTDIARALLG